MNTSRFKEPPQAYKIAHTPEQACSALGIGKTKLFELLKTGQIQGLKIGQRRLITDESLRTLVSRLTEAA